MIQNTIALLLLAFFVQGTFTVWPAYSQQDIAEVTPQNLLACKTFTGGTEFTISTHGNVIQFEGPLGYEHIAAGTFGEGYVLCNGATNRFDLGAIESGFGASSCVCPNAKTCIVTRDTADGLMRLRQDFTYLQANGQRALSIKMTVTNRTGSNIAGVILRRQVDFDVDTEGSLGTGLFSNHHAASETDAVFSWNDAADHPGADHMVMLKHLTPNLPREAKVTANIIDSTCSPADVANAGPVVGDFGQTLQYNLGGLNAGASKSVSLQYQRN